MTESIALNAYQGSDLAQEWIGLFLKTEMNSKGSSLLLQHALKDNEEIKNFIANCTAQDFGNMYLAMRVIEQAEIDPNDRTKAKEMNTELLGYFNFDKVLTPLYEHYLKNPGLNNSDLQDFKDAATPLMVEAINEKIQKLNSLAELIGVTRLAIPDTRDDSEPSSKILSELQSNIKEIIASKLSDKTFINTLKANQAAEILGYFSSPKTIKDYIDDLHKSFTTSPTLSENDKIAVKFIRSLHPTQLEGVTRPIRVIAEKIQQTNPYVAPRPIPQSVLDKAKSVVGESGESGYSSPQPSNRHTSPALPSH